MFKNIVESLKKLDESVGDLKQNLDPLTKKTMTQVVADISPLQKAKLQLVLMYSLNSTVWAYMRLIGKDPKESALKQELDRVRDYMKRAKDVEDKLSAAEPSLRINKAAAKRTMKHALWQAAQSKGKQTDRAVSGDTTAAGDEEDWGAGCSKAAETPSSPVKKRKNYVVDQFLTENPSCAQQEKEPSPKKRQKIAK